MGVGVASGVGVGSGVASGVGVGVGVGAGVGRGVGSGVGAGSAVATMAGGSRRANGSSASGTKELVRAVAIPATASSIAAAGERSFLYRFLPLTGS